MRLGKQRSLKYLTSSPIKKLDAYFQVTRADRDSKVSTIN